MLEVKNLHSYYGKSHILHDVSLSVGGGEVVGILGRNGVGKTTLLRSIVGLVADMSGDILLDGESVLELSAAELARRGVVYIRESRMIFGTLSVADNLRLVGGLGGAGGDVSAIYDRFPRLADRRSHLGSQLSGGEQKILALARGVLMQPRYLLLDEIGEGLSPMMLAEVREILLRLVDMGTGILLVEQNLSFALSVMDRAYVLGMGEIRFSGNVDELRKNENLQKQLLSV